MARFIISAIILLHLAAFCVPKPRYGRWRTNLGVVSDVVDNLSGHSFTDKVDQSDAAGAGVDQSGAAGVDQSGAAGVDQSGAAGVDQSDTAGVDQSGAASDGADQSGGADNEDDHSESGDEEDGSLDEEEVFGDEDSDPEEQDSESTYGEGAEDGDDDFVAGDNGDLSVGNMHLSRPYPVAPGRPYPGFPNRPSPGFPNRPYQFPSQRPTAVCRARYSYHPEKADWEGARLICQMEGGQLATITGEASQGRIGSRFGSMPEFWIGATDIEREGQFRWVNGQGLGFARWYSSQPNKKYPNNEHCVTFNYWGKDTKWGDRNCYDSRPFLCETTVCTPSVSRFPSGYPNQFRGPLMNPYQFPRNQNFPGPQGLDGIASQNWPRGRGFPYDRYQGIPTPINLG